MAIFDKFFKKDKQTKEKSFVLNEKQKDDNNAGGFDNFRLLALSSDDIAGINESAEYISNIIPLYVSNLNTIHVLHPENLINFSRLWFKTEKQNRMIDIPEEDMINYLSISLGKYIHDSYDVVWRNIADMNNVQNGNVVVEFGLVEKDSNIMIFPMQLILKVLSEESNCIHSELAKLKKRENKIKNSNIKDLLMIARTSGKGKDVFELWKAILELDEWCFISIYEEDVQKVRPFVGLYEDTPWILVFTDTTTAQKFAKSDRRFLGVKGECIVINSPVKNAIETIFNSEKKGVYGIKMNEEDDINGSFNIPISVLKQIIELKNRV